VKGLLFLFVEIDMSNEMEERLIRFAANNSIMFSLMREGHLPYPNEETSAFIFGQFEQFLDELIPVLAECMGKDEEYLDKLYNTTINGLEQIVKRINKDKPPEEQIQIVVKRTKLH
jgi:hypothetical protein